jgi:hypothetical protein
MLSRRSWLGLVAVGACISVVRPARAGDLLEVAAANNAIGAIVAAEGGEAVHVVIDPTLGPLEIRIAGVGVDVSGTILLKGRFLDDPRHAAKLGASIRNAIVAAQPALKAQIEANHKAWTHPFARRIIAWNAKLARSSLRGQRVADAYGRAALLEWAGATIDPTSTAKGPAALATAPRGPAAPTLASYTEYLEALVAAVA